MACVITFFATDQITSYFVPEDSTAPRSSLRAQILTY